MQEVGIWLCDRTDGCPDVLLCETVVEAELVKGFLRLEQRDKRGREWVEMYNLAHIGRIRVQDLDQPALK